MQESADILAVSEMARVGLQPEEVKRRVEIEGFRVGGVLHLDGGGDGIRGVGVIPNHLALIRPSCRRLERSDGESTLLSIDNGADGEALIVDDGARGSSRGAVPAGARG